MSVHAWRRGQVQVSSDHCRERPFLPPACPPEPQSGLICRRFHQGAGMPEAVVWPASSGRGSHPGGGKTLGRQGTCAFLLVVWGWLLLPMNLAQHLAVAAFCNLPFLAPSLVTFNCRISCFRDLGWERDRRVRLHCVFDRGVLTGPSHTMEGSWIDWHTGWPLLLPDVQVVDRGGLSSLGINFRGVEKMFPTPVRGAQCDSSFPSSLLFPRCLEPRFLAAPLSGPCWNVNGMSPTQGQ